MHKPVSLAERVDDILQRCVIPHEHLVYESAEFYELLEKWSQHRVRWAGNANVVARVLRHRKLGASSIVGVLLPFVKDHVLTSSPIDEAAEPELPAMQLAVEPASCCWLAGRMNSGDRIPPFAPPMPSLTSGR